jgi:hypothetical protein
MYMYVKLITDIAYDQQMNPNDFVVVRSKVKVTVYLGHSENV